MTSDTTAIGSSHARLAADPALTPVLAVMIIAAATISGAWFFQLVLDIQPCPLCLEQRYAYYLIVPLAALLAFGAARGASRPLLVAGLVVIALAALGNSVLGTYHAGVEWKLWAGPTDCTGPIGNFGSASNPLRRGAMALPRSLACRLQRADLGVDGRDRSLWRDSRRQALTSRARSMCRHVSRA